MSRARDLAKLGNTNVIAVNGTDVGFGTLDPKEKVNVVGVVSATSFFGDGSGLDGIASAGIGTALSDDKTKALNTIYYTNNEVLVSNNSTINPPDSGNIAYTQAPTIVVEDTVEITVSDGDDLLVDVLGISTGTNVDYAARGNGVFGNIYVDNIWNQSGQTSVNFPKGIVSSGITTITDGTQSTSATTGALQVIGGVGIAKSVYIGGNLSVGGTITYEDVTNVDSIGIITARNGISVTDGTIYIKSSGNYTDITGASDAGMVLGTGSNASTGIQLRTSGTGVSRLYFGDNSGGDNGRKDGFITYSQSTRALSLGTAQGERINIGSAGQLGVAGANYGSSGQVLTSGGPSAAPSWADAGGGQWTFLGASSGDISNGTSTIDITDTLITSTYYRYKLVFNINTDVGDPSGKTGFRFKANNAWVSSTIYRNASRNATGGMAASYMDRASLVEEDIRVMFGEMILWNPLNASNMPHDITITGVAFNNKNLINSSGYWSGTTVIQLDENSGTNHPITGIQINSERTIVDTNAGNAQRTFWTLYGDKGA